MNLKGLLVQVLTISTTDVTILIVFSSHYHARFTKEASFMVDCHQVCEII